MPFAFDLLDEEEQKKQQGGEEGAPAMTGGGESFGGGGSQAATAPQEKGTAKQGSGFVSLDKYMTANQGNNLGGEVTGKVQGSIDQAKQSLEQGANDFTNASNQGAPKWNTVQDQVKGTIDSAGDQTSKEDMDKVKNYAGATYQGPENFYGSAYGSGAQGGVQKAAQQAKALQTEGGRFALLDQYFGRPKYTMGEKALDNLFVQNTPGVQARAQSVSGQAKGLKSQADQTAQAMDNLAAQNKEVAAETGRNTRDYLNQALSGFENDLNSRFDAYNAENDAYNQARYGDVSDDLLDDETRGLYGLNEGDSLYDLNLQNYLQQTPQASKGEFASDQDYARYLALSQLAGDEPSLLLAEDRTKAGSAQSKGRLGVDKAKISEDIGARKAAYESSAAPIQQGIAETQPKLAAAQQAYDLHYASLPETENVVTGERVKQENATTRQLRALVQQYQSQLNDYNSQFSALNAALHPDRKVGRQ